MAGLTLLSGPALAAAPKRAGRSRDADLAQAVYGDFLSTARELRSAVENLLARPSAETLTTARRAWTASRVPYQQSEAYRFGNAIVDDWEGKVNAWPLDEGLIDYVTAGDGADSQENPLFRANVIANPAFDFAGKPVDAAELTKELLGGTLHELGGVETNVATGCHAIEFLLWGQDLNGTGPGARPASDFDPKNCSWGNCDRRAAYLKAAVDLLLDDLAWMRAQWGPNGVARADLTAGGVEQGLAAILTGMGSLSYGELAGERMQLGLLLHAPEEEHDCFSDNTHHSRCYNALGIRNVYLGEYRRVDGSMIRGPGISALVAAASPATDARLRGQLQATSPPWAGS